MTRVIERLHGPTPVGAWPNTGLLSPGAQRIVANACLTREHLAGLLVWLGAGGLLVVFASVTFSRTVGLALLIVVAAVPGALIATRRGEHRQRVIDALPEMIEGLSRSLRSGASFSQAMREAGAEAAPELGGELAAVVEATSCGQSSEHALRDWVERLPCAEIRIVGAACALASHNESGAMHALQGVSQSLRDRADLASEVRALASQATASLRALVLLPVGFLALDVAAGQRSIQYLTNTSLGQLCLGIGMALNVVGAFWMRRLVDRRSLL